MIVKSRDGGRKKFLGVSFDVLATGRESMITRMNYKRGDHVPPHRHPNEQSGYVVSGQVHITFGEHDERLGPGDSYSIPQNTEHSIRAVEDSVVLDFFVPPRKDYL